MNIKLTINKKKKKIKKKKKKKIEKKIELHQMDWKIGLNYL